MAAMVNTGGPAALADVLGRIEQATLSAIREYDPHQKLSESNATEVAKTIIAKVQQVVVVEERRTALDDRDHGYIRSRARSMMKDRLEAQTLRFILLDRVICFVGGEHGWLPGAVQGLNKEDPEDPTGETIIPYVVKVDPPISSLISVPSDENALVRPEICFGQREDALSFTAMCMWKRPGTKPQRRFGQGERVSCAVEDATNQFSDWRAGTVMSVNLTVAGAGKEGEDLLMPYQVKLDSGCTILVHRDEHWLVRDLAFQPDGPRISADGSHCVSRFSQRSTMDGCVEKIDHATRNVRKTNRAISEFRVSA